MKRWIPLFVTIATATATALAPQAQTAIGQHPKLAIALTGIWAMLNLLHPSPLNGPQKP